MREGSQIGGLRADLDRMSSCLDDQENTIECSNNRNKPNHHHYHPYHHQSQHSKHRHHHHHHHHHKDHKNKNNNKGNKKTKDCIQYMCFQLSNSVSGVVTCDRQFSSCGSISLGYQEYIERKYPQIPRHRRQRIHRWRYLIEIATWEISRPDGSYR